MALFGAVVRRAVVVAMLSVTATVILVPATSAAAFAAKRKKPPKKAPKAAKAAKGVRAAKAAKPVKGAKAAAETARTMPRTIKKEEGLAPKKEYKLDEDLGKTKDLKQTEALANRPTLTPEELKRAETESLMDEKLDEEIDLARKLLDLETDCDGASAVRFRVADLYWEKSKRAFFKANDFNTPEAERNRFADLMKRLQATSIANFEKIAAECDQYKDFPKVLFYLGKALMEVDRAKEGATYFKRIIKDFPSSEWVGQAWFMIGEFFFNSANDARAALTAYVKAAEYPKGGMYGFALYKQGWCYVNTGEFNLAMDKFKQVVNVSDDPTQDMDAKGRLSLRKEALKDYVRAYAKAEVPAAGAPKTFLALGGKDMLSWMLEQLGNWYVNADNHAGVVAVYEDLIKLYPRSTRLPVYEGRVVNATSRMGDKKQVVTEAKKLTDFFEALRARIAKGDISADDKKTIDKDVKEAEEIAENTLRRLAQEYHKEAKKLKGQAERRTFEFALELYKNYLAVFPQPKPDADVNYVFYMRFYYAEVLYKLEEFLDAARNYDIVVDMDPHPKDAKKKELVLAAAEESVRAFDEVVADEDRKKPPELGGTEPKDIPPLKLDLIRACKRYIDYVGSEGEKIVEIRYKMARIYYTYNHFEQAAPAFNDIVTNHPTNSVACYAANLVLDIYNGKKDYRNLRDSSRAYLASKDLACGDDDKKKFADIEEKSSFFLIKADFEEKKKYVAAANAYLDFYKNFPKSELNDDAVYNAAVNYDLGNRLDKANEVRKFLVEKLPDSPLVPETLYNIAQSYERVVDFEHAAQYLELFAKRFPTDKRSKDAIFNAALYRATLNDYEGGKAGREKYIAAYPGEADLYQTAFAICESLEDEAGAIEEQAKTQKKAELGKAAQQKWEQAHNCYMAYIKNPAYVKANTDMMCRAQYRRGVIMRDKTNYEKGWEDQKKYLLNNWPNWKRQGLETLPRCAAAIAEIQFKDVDWRIAKYKQLTISELNPTDAGKKKFEASVGAKIKERDALVEVYKKIVEIGVAEWALASLFDIGELYRDSIQKLLEAPVPDKIPGYKLSAEDKGMLKQQLKEMAAPIEATAVEAYRLCVGKANELGVYNRWTVKALDQLHKLRPEDYPLVTEYVLPLRYEDRLKVVANAFVIPEGDTFKSVDITFKTAESEKADKDAAAKDAKGTAKPAKEGAEDAKEGKPARGKPGKHKGGEAGGAKP